MGKSNIEQLAILEEYLDKGGSVFRKYCGMKSGPYCNACVSYTFHAGENDKLYCNGKKMTYCPTSITWCYKNLASIPPYLALPSDIIYFDWELNGTPNHVGFVKERKSCDEIYTIEGNTDKVDSKGKVLAHGVVAYRTRNTKYVQAVFRPHFKPTAFDPNKALVIDGLMGYNTIAMLQKALGVTVDGILGKGTVRALQKIAGTTQDGHWGNGTSRAVQKMLGVTADGLFGPNSVKALQRWCNDKVFPQQVETWVDKANAWAKKTAASGKYKYKKWTSNANTHKCPICNPGSGNGWNCIGWAFSIWRHGGGLKNRCSCGVVSSGKNGQWDRLLSMSQTEADKYASSLVGVPVKVIRNGGKAIPLSSLRAGDICCLYKNGTAEHIIYYMGNGKYSDSGRGQTPNIQAGRVLSSNAKAKLKLALRYTGK